MTLPLSMACCLVLALTPSAVWATPPGESARHLRSFDFVWTAIRDRHHDPTLGGLDWNALREELRPRVEAAKDAATVRAVLRDLIDSGAIPTVRLTQVFRQAKGSEISLQAQRINAGKGSTQDIEMLSTVANQMVGRTLCPLGDFATSPITGTLKWFKNEYQGKVGANGSR